MANAKQCDRCGRLYNGRMYVPDLKILMYRHPYGEEPFDLCDDCLNKIVIFLTVKGELK